LSGELAHANERSATLATIRPICPEPPLRLQERVRGNNSLVGFHPFLEQRAEPIDEFMMVEERFLQEFVALAGNRVRLLKLRRTRASSR